MTITTLQLKNNGVLLRYFFLVAVLAPLEPHPAAFTATASHHERESREDQKRRPEKLPEATREKSEIVQKCHNTDNDKDASEKIHEINLKLLTWVDLGFSIAQTANFELRNPNYE